jgi:hypothetical protein
LVGTGSGGPGSGTPRVEGWLSGQRAARLGPRRLRMAARRHRERVPRRPPPGSPDPVHGRPFVGVVSRAPGLPCTRVGRLGPGGSRPPARLRPVGLRPGGSACQRLADGRACPATGLARSAVADTSGREPPDRPWTSRAPGGDAPKRSTCQRSLPRQALPIRAPKRETLCGRIGVGGYKPHRYTALNGRLPRRCPSGLGNWR